MAYHQWSSNVLSLPEQKGCHFADNGFMNKKLLFIFLSDAKRLTFGVVITMHALRDGDHYGAGFSSLVAPAIVVMMNADATSVDRFGIVAILGLGVFLSAHYTS